MRTGTLRHGNTGILPDFRALPDSLLSAFRAESDRWFLWSPVGLGCGIALYFSLSFEPPLWASIGLAACTGLAMFFARRRLSDWAGLMVTALFCVALGLAAATYRTASVAGPVLQKTWSGTLEGRVVSVETTAQNALSVVIEPDSMQRLSPDETPARVRLSIRIKNVALEPGEAIRLRARLLPPPDPVEPEGFDYARQVWFERIGAVGFAYTKPERLAPPPHDAVTWLARLRADVTTRVRETIGGPAGAVAAALITGEKRAIPDETSAALRRAGLAHVLSISGLHMVLFAGSLFWLLRAGFAAVPRLALYYPIKKYAAIAALFGATAYLLLSGAGIATQRAWIMIGLMFIAILLDRPAISMRNVALAALVILLWRPESLLSASFHMSFAAVVALIAFYETPFIQRLLMPAGRQSRLAPLALFRFIGRYLLGIAFTTAVAGVATGAFSAFHFNHIEPYSMVGNLGALPVVSIVIMPAALVALMLMPFGLDEPALWVMGQGIELMLTVAHFVASLDGAEGLVASAPVHALAIVTFGGLWLALWRGHWRYLGVLPIIIGLALWQSGQPADLMVNRDGKLVALRDADGHLMLSASRPSYAAEIWLRHDGDARTPKQASSDTGKICDDLGCVWTRADGTKLAMPLSLAALREDCIAADIIVARFGIPRRLRKSCKAHLVIDRFDLWRDGATAVWLSDKNWTRLTARETRGARPWVPTRGSSKN